MFADNGRSNNNVKGKGEMERNNIANWKNCMEGGSFYKRLWNIQVLSKNPHLQE